MLVFSTGSVEKLFRNSCSVVNIPPYFLLLSHSCLKDYLTHLVLQVLLWKNRILYFSKVCMTKSLVLLSHIPLMQCVVSLLILMSFVFCLLFCLLFSEKLQFTPCIITIQNSSLTDCIIGNNNRQCITCDQHSFLAQNDASNGKCLCSRKYRSNSRVIEVIYIYIYNIMIDCCLLYFIHLYKIET